MMPWATFRPLRCSSWPERLYMSMSEGQGGQVEGTVGQRCLLESLGGAFLDPYPYPLRLVLVDSRPFSSQFMRLMQPHTPPLGRMMPSCMPRSTTCSCSCLDASLVVCQSKYLTLCIFYDYAINIFHPYLCRLIHHIMDQRVEVKQ